MNAKFCFVCGSPLVMRYPGGDPENGAATPRCKNDEHPTLEEREYGRNPPLPNEVRETIRDSIQTSMEDVDEGVYRGSATREDLEVALEWMAG